MLNYFIKKKIKNPFFFGQCISTRFSFFWRRITPLHHHSMYCVWIWAKYIFFFCELVHFGASFQMMWMADTPSRLIDRFLVVEVFFNLLFNPCFWKQPVWTMEAQTLFFSIITTSTTVFLDCGGLGKKRVYLKQII